MNITANIRVNMRDREVLANCRQAGEQAMLETVVDIGHDAIRDSPYLTGNNARSISYQVDGLRGKVFSTSGYGGFLETGTRFMGARPYMRPALERHFTADKFAERMRRHLS